MIDLEFRPRSRSGHARETEVARVAFGAAGEHVGSVRACRLANGYFYRVVVVGPGGPARPRGASRHASGPLSLGELAEWFLGVWPLGELIAGRRLGKREAVGLVDPSSRAYPGFEALIIAKVIDWTTGDAERELERANAWQPLPEKFPDGTVFLIRDDVVPMTYGPDGPGCPGGHLTWAGRVPMRYGSYSGLLEADRVSEAEFRALVARRRGARQ